MDVLISIIGWCGTILLLLAYALLTARRLRASGALYQAMNLVGGLALLLNTAYAGAWPSAALNLVWFGIGAAGLLRTRRIRGDLGVSDRPPAAAREER
ncbi:hypothetical protein N1031_13520 [Herbiconiux moechotypicola]|uniref:CBU-0592-like domain-containing protein n=1 Tax=Herbiconiux moechotypicola TaxID=637393 RepID=A0ABN3DWY9_9MICO|nr:hypothetical protein [Herbiconiux moechotypicola]MCS5730781.1 hypothetical protein [Herbiconiux moechotypicola]